MNTLARPRRARAVLGTMALLVALALPVGANAVGVRGPVVVSKFDISEEDEEGVTYDVELKEVEDEQPAGTAFEMQAISIAVTAG